MKVREDAKKLRANAERAIEKAEEIRRLSEECRAQTVNAAHSQLTDHTRR